MPAKVSIQELWQEQDHLAKMLSDDPTLRRAIEPRLKVVVKQLTEELRRYVATLHDIVKLISGKKNWKEDEQFKWALDAEHAINTKQTMLTTTPEVQE